LRQTGIFCICICLFVSQVEYDTYGLLIIRYWLAFWVTLCILRRCHYHFQY